MPIRLPSIVWRSGRLLLAKRVHELDQVDGRVPILGGRGMEALLLAVRQAIKSRLVLGRCIDEGLGDGDLELFRQVGADSA